MHADNHPPCTHMDDKLQIFENNKDHLPDFIRLSEAWISHYFEIEDADRALAARPEKIIDDVGYVFSMTLNDEVIGVCAMFNHDGNVYELARMAVTSEHQGKGYGDQLIRVCLQKARDTGARAIYLISNTKLEPAITLYKKHGFRIVSTKPHPVYSRANITMEMPLV